MNEERLIDNANDHVLYEDWRKKKKKKRKEGFYILLRKEEFMEVDLIVIFDLFEILCLHTERAFFNDSIIISHLGLRNAKFLE